LQIVELGFGDIRPQFVASAPTGEGPDMFIGAHDWIGELVVNGLIAPVDLGDQAENFDPNALAAFTFDGDLYGVPYAIENVGLFYNTELVETPPATWAEVREQSQALIDSGEAEYGFIIDQGNGFIFYPIQTAFGGYIFGEDEDGNLNPEDIGIDSEGSIAALAWLEGMVEDGLIPAGLGGGDVDSLFINGEAAMIITGPWNIPTFVAEEVPFAIAPIPASAEDGEPGAPFLGVRGWMVNQFSENSLLAQAFLTDFVATEEYQQAVFDAEGRPPVFASVSESVDNEYVQQILVAGETGRAMPAIPEMGDVWGAWGDAITLTMQGERTAQEAFSEAADSIRASIAGE
jgi:maltose/maltodextrin transport system substrate-binding protein/arabinogalactan oligomer/maltooligosaccharide transport system substrate-binding protein